MSPEKVEEVRRDGITKVYPGYLAQSSLYGRALSEMREVDHRERGIFGLRLDFRPFQPLDFPPHRPSKVETPVLGDPVALRGMILAVGEDRMLPGEEFFPLARPSPAAWPRRSCCCRRSRRWGWRCPLPLPGHAGRVVGA